MSVRTNSRAAAPLPIKIKRAGTKREKLRLMKQYQRQIATSLRRSLREYDSLLSNPPNSEDLARDRKIRSEGLKLVRLNRRICEIQPCCNSYDITSSRPKVLFCETPNCLEVHYEHCFMLEEEEDRTYCYSECRYLKD